MRGYSLKYCRMACLPVTNTHTRARANPTQQSNPLPIPTYSRVFNAWATCPVRSSLKRSQSIDHDPAVVPVEEVSREEEGKVVVDKGSPVEV